MKNEKNEWGPTWTRFGSLILVTIQQHARTKKSLMWAQKKLFQNALTANHKLFTVKQKKHKSLEIVFDRDIKRLVFLWVETIEIVAYDWIISELKERAKTCF